MEDVDTPPVADINAEVIKGVLMEFVIIGNDDHEVGPQTLADEGDVAMRPGLRRLTEQPRIEARGLGQAPDPDAEVELARLEGRGWVS